MSSTNVKNSHISHLLTQMVAAGKSTSKKRVEMDNLYKGPQISPLFSSTMQNNASSIISQKCTENNVLASVLKRVNTLEGNLEKSKKRLKQALSVIKEKDNEIVRLKEQIRLLQDEQKTKKASQVDISALSDLTNTLETRISAIESFLKGDPYFWYKSDEFTNEQFSESCASPDLDLLLQQINELNFEAGEVHICQKTTQGASFKGCQSIALVFYENGMQLEGHPFRDYSDLRTQFFIKDIIDGYFPSELQCEYPRGVIFNVSDRRNETYVDDDACNHLFKGQGCRLDVTCDPNGNNIKDTSLKRKKFHSSLSNCDEAKAEKDKNNMFMSTLPVGSDQFTQIMHLNKDLFKRRLHDAMSKNIYPFGASGAGDGNFNIYRQSNGEHFSLPNITIKDGHVYNKRFNRSSKQGASCMNTSRIKYLNPSARTTDSCIQLKIRSINDKDLFILTMHVNEPVGKLRSYLPDDVKECNIMYFKDDYNRIYLTDNKSTLKECGILKNSVLVLCKHDQNIE